MPSKRLDTRTGQALDAYLKLTRAAQSVTNALEDGLRAAGLTSSQFGVLEALHHLGPLSQSELADTLRKSSGNLTLVVDNLERRRLVKRRRDTGDRRKVIVHLSAKGGRLIADVFPRHARVVRDTMAALPPYELRHLADLCRRLGLGVSRTDEP
jgi:MarR family 2-MHQ and catechol resistance regulon transcriptional repressor